MRENTFECVERGVMDLRNYDGPFEDFVKEVFSTDFGSRLLPHIAWLKWL